MKREYELLVRVKVVDLDNTPPEELVQLAMSGADRLANALTEDKVGGAFGIVVKVPRNGVAVKVESVALVAQ